MLPYESYMMYQYMQTMGAQMQGIGGIPSGNEATGAAKTAGQSITGATGPAGLTGPTGPQGATGAAGASIEEC